MNTGKVLLGVLAGVATGALLGILFAPEKGSKTRKRISKKGEDYADALKENFNEFLESISEKSEEVMDEFSDTRKRISKKGEVYAEALKEKFNEFLESISEKFEEVKGEVSDITEHTKANFEEAKKDVKAIKG